MIKTIILGRYLLSVGWSLLYIISRLVIKIVHLLLRGHLVLQFHVAFSEYISAHPTSVYVHPQHTTSNSVDAPDLSVAKSGVVD